MTIERMPASESKREMRVASASCVRTRRALRANSLCNCETTASGYPGKSCLPKIVIDEWRDAVAPNPGQEPVPVDRGRSTGSNFTLFAVTQRPTRTGDDQRQFRRKFR